MRWSIASKHRFQGCKIQGKKSGQQPFLGDVRISTNVMDKEGSRPSESSDERVQELFLERNAMDPSAFVVDDGISRLRPIRDVQDKIVGCFMWDVGEQVCVDEGKIDPLFFLLHSGMLIALTVSFFLSRMMFKR